MKRTWLWMLFGVMLMAACQPATNPIDPAAPSAGQAKLKVVAAETFLADIAQNVAGERATVKSLMPLGVDPHSFEPTPQEVAAVAESTVLIVNGAGFEGFVDELLKNAGGERTVIEASAGLTPRQPADTENVDEPLDPHFWLDPNHVIKYVENIRDALQKIDPVSAVYYGANADKYIQQLIALDQAIRAQISTIPENRRLIVTNHESFGYFADRYGFKIIGTIIPGVSTGAAPSAQQLAHLIDTIKAAGASAIFLETGTNPQLAQQIASETGVTVVTDLYSHSLSEAGGPAPTYIAMIQTNVAAIVKALK